MALSFSGLSAYTKQLVKPLLTQAVTDNKIQQLIMSEGIVLPNVKSSASIPLMDTDAVFGTQSCSFDPSGTTTFSQRTVTVGKIKVEEKICTKDMEAYFLQEALKAGSTYEDFGNSDFQKTFLDKKNARIASQLGTAIFQGDTNSTDPNLNKFDGLIKLIDAGSPVDANVSGYTGVATITTLTASNVLAAFKGVKNAIPQRLKGKPGVKIFCGFDVWEMYQQALIDANNFHYTAVDALNYEINIPGTTLKVIADHGLDGTGDIYALYMPHVAMAVDLEDEESNYKMWFSEDNNDVRYRVEFKIGVNVAYTNDCVKFKAAV
jgi:hypothetical protein